MALQTKTFTQAGDKGYSLKLELTEESTSVSANTSLVSYAFYLVRTTYGFYSSQPFTWNITIGGKTIAISNFKFQISTSDPAEQLIKSGQVTVAHASDGTKTMSFSVSTPDASGISPTYGPTAMQMTGTWALTTIPRASTISVANTNIGSAATIKISRASSSFTHTLTYSFGGLTGTIATKTTSTSVSWTVPTTFYAQIPNAKSGTCTITCVTYSGSTNIGSKTAAFSAIASESACKPTVSGTVVSTDTLSSTLTGGTSTLVRYVSTARATITATGKNSATISKRTVNGQSLTTTKDFAKVSTGTFVFSATDSRGYSNSATATSSIIQYIPLTLTPTVKRKTPTGDIAVLTIKGNYWEGSFGAVSNALTLSYQYKSETGTWSTETAVTGATISSNTYSVSVEVPGIDYQKSYTFRFVAKDKAKTLTLDVGLSQGVPVFDWGKSDFRFHVPVVAGGRTVQIDSAGGNPTLHLSRDGVILGGISLSNSTDRLYLYSTATNTGKYEYYVIDPADPDLAASKTYYLLTSKIAPDYVIAQGTSGSWRWRKWKSGLAECWQRASIVAANSFAAWGSIYTCELPESRKTLPFTFTDTPKIIAQLDNNVYNGWLNLWSGGGKADTSHTGAYSIARATPLETGQTFVMNYYVQGFYAS